MDYSGKIYICRQVYSLQHCFSQGNISDVKSSMTYVAEYIVSVCLNLL